MSPLSWRNPFLVNPFVADRPSAPGPSGSYDFPLAGRTDPARVCIVSPTAASSGASVCGRATERSRGFWKPTCSGPSPG